MYLIRKHGKRGALAVILIFYMCSQNYVWSQKKSIVHLAKLCCQNSNGMKQSNLANMKHRNGYTANGQNISYNLA